MLFCSPGWLHIPGALLPAGVEYSPLCRQSAHFTDKILGGMTPAECDVRTKKSVLLCSKFAFTLGPRGEPAGGPLGPPTTSQDAGRRA